MSNDKPKCWWHPDKDAKWIVNLGTSFDLDTPACDKCKKQIEDSNKYNEYRHKATIKSI